MNLVRLQEGLAVIGEDGVKLAEDGWGVWSQEPGRRPRLRVLLFVTASLWSVLACACVRASEPVRASVCWGPGVA